jgi:hypothetical protein
VSAWSMGTRESGDASGFTGAFWLARKEMRQAWPTYPLTGLLLLLSGFFVVPSLSGVFELRGFGDVGHRTEEFYNAFFSDCLFLVICAFLAVNVVPGGYARVRRGAFYAKLRFFRKLPIPAGSVVGSRALGMLFALILGAPAFFLPAFLISELGELGASYLWFAGIWIGYCLLASGFYLLLELTESGRTLTLISNGFVVSLVLALALLEWTVDLGLVGRTVELVHDYGSLPAILSILAGGAAFAILAWTTAGRLKKRNLSGDLSV